MREPAQVWTCDGTGGSAQRLTHVNADLLRARDLGEAEDQLPVAYDGDELDIGFNANYLLEVLRYLPGDDVRMSLKAPERAATFEPVDEELVFLCLVMPLRLLD